MRGDFAVRLRSRGLVALATAAWIWVLGVAAFAQDSALKVSPQDISFQDAYARRQLLTEQGGQDVTLRAEYRSAEPAIAEVDAAGYVQPRGIGETTITVSMTGPAGALSATVPVKVTALNSDRRIDFATEIQPLLTRYSCNSGGCHGKASGQNGFRLSLFGFDSEFDYRALVSEARGRRISATTPERSLLLAKATAQLPHGGGRRIEPGSEPHQVLLAWIRSGAPQSAPDAPRVVRVVIEPAERIFVPGGTQQLRVTARYSDGAERDVTRQTDYASNLDVVAAVSKEGHVTTTDGTGEATVMARYMGQVAVFRAIRPHGAPLAEIPEFQPINEIDRLALAKWKKLGLRPSPVCDDATFLRRATIDLAGRLPTIDETKEFLSDAAADKRERIVARLLDSPDYAAYFALKWSAILRNSRLAGADQAAYAFHNWIKDSIAQNRPYDEFVRGIVAASGEWQDAPAINWYWQSRDDQLHTVTADTAQLFLGVRLQCARCHHHPYERWGQGDYFGLAGFYARLGRKSFGQPPPYFSSSQRTTSERNPATGKELEPKFLEGEVVDLPPEQDPRHALVDWMAKPENPFFAKAYVNRIWGHFFSIGLVNEVDDMRETNPPSNPEILDFLAGEFTRTKFDRKHIARLIAGSRLYQLSADPRPENERDRQNFARFYARRMIAEVLLDAVDQACGTRTNFGNMSATARAIDLPHEGFGSYFMDTFDRPGRVSVCECERSPGATLSQVLLLGNSDEIENKLADGNGRIAKSEQGKVPPETMVEDLYLAAFSRRPTSDERTTALGYLQSAADKRKAAEDLLWTLLNSREFSFNH